MYQTLSRSGEEVSHYAIGTFGDTRLARVGALLFKRLSEKLTVSIRTLGGNRATEVAFNRFLENKKTSVDTIVNELAKIIAKVIGFKGDINFDASKPDGSPRKLLDVSRLTTMGWKSSIDLEQGLSKTYDWYLDNVDSIRG